MATQVSVNASIHKTQDRDIEGRKAFDEKTCGVKGLVDAGVTKVPKFFTRSPEDISKDFKMCTDETLQVPIVDFTRIGDENGRKVIIEEMVRASEEWGVFHVVNHGVSMEVQNKVLDGIRMFHEQDAEIKAKVFDRDPWSIVSYQTNHHFYESRAASWRDTLSVRNFFPPGLHAQALPSICREAIIEYTNEGQKFGELVFELISIGLGLKPKNLLEAGCAEGWAFFGHYYPPCPEPELTLGLNKHVDPSVLTVLLEDQIGGLQVLRDNLWVNIKPVSGALTVFIGAMLQMMTNDKLKAFWHRTAAKKVGPRISATIFFTGFVSDERKYAPIKELTSEENPPNYTQFTLKEVAAKTSVNVPDIPAWAYFKKHGDQLGNEIFNNEAANIVMNHDPLTV